MACEVPIRAAAAPSISLEQGLPPAIDEAAAAADPRHAFLRRSWFAAAAGDSPAATLVARRAGGQVIAALPIVRAGPRLLGIRAVPGCYWPFRSFPLARDIDDGELAALLAAPAAREALGRAWRLGPVMDNDPTAARLLKLARRCGWSVLARRTATSWAFDIDAARAAEPWPKPSTARNMHKHEKKLARLGALDFRFVTGEGWDAGALDALAAIERNSWAGSRAGADPKFVDPALRRGWDEVIRDPALAAMLSAGILSIGGSPVAFSFGLDCGRTRYCIATSYDQDFARHSPGYLTGYWTYAAAMERGVALLSLGAGDGGEKSGMGALPEAELMDYLFVRGAARAALLRPLWRRSGG
ncbi:MAG TPA: GNAT family N-acetyltransferase [Allosphingosinicella sp.]|nr:GNAT family N-acetyltransferase [Allosphingosinicella sp.]